MNKSKFAMATLIVFASIGAAFAAHNPFLAVVKYRLDAQGKPVAPASATHTCLVGIPPCTADFDTSTTPPTEIPGTRVNGIYVP